MRIGWQTLMAACTVAAGMTAGPATAGAVKVEVRATASGYTLVRGGEPYAVRGVGMATNHVERLRLHGGNSIRNWTTRDDAGSIRELLDAAHANGVTVMLCLPVQAERWGFDYDDADAVAAQLEALRGDVLAYRDHPALLAWIVGNELNHSYTNPRVYDAVDDIARMIHELDPNHPVTTTVAGIDEAVVAEIVERAPALDFISFQAYGQLFVLREFIERTGFDRPFMVTEWGAIGYWEVGRTPWGAPIEMTSSQKADVFLRAHREMLAPSEGQLLGSYAFFWGQKQERTPTWFGLLTEGGEQTEAIDVLHFVWNGAWPDNRAPAVHALRLNGAEARSGLTVSPGEPLEARLDALDPDGDPLTFRWELKPESEATQVGGDYEHAIGSLDGAIEDRTAATARLKAPGPGAYRLFVYVYDGQGHAGHANFPFLVTGAPE
jgi:hypothetical protein